MRRTRAWILGLVIMTAFGALPAHGRIEPGRHEISVSGYLAAQQRGDDWTVPFEVDFLLGLVVSRHVEVGGTLRFAKREGSDSEHGFGPVILIYPWDPSWSANPFLGLSAAKEAIEDHDTYSIEATGGVKAFLSRDSGGAISLQAFYRRSAAIWPTRQEKTVHLLGGRIGVSLFQ